jgi:hypothetical protein
LLFNKHETGENESSDDPSNPEFNGLTEERMEEGIL